MSTLGTTNRSNGVWRFDASAFTTQHVEIECEVEVPFMNSTIPRTQTLKR